MNPITKIIIVFALLFAITGCASHLVHIKGKRMDTTHEGIKPGAAIYVVEKNNLNQPEKMISCKQNLLKFLVSHGFKESDYKTADYYLALGYHLSIGKEATENVQVMINYADFGPNNGGGFAPISPSPISMKNTRSTFEINITAKLIDANTYKQTSQLKEIWIGRARTNINYPGSFDEVVSMMLPIVLEKINENVDAEIVVKESGF